MPQAQRHAIRCTLPRPNPRHGHTRPKIWAPRAPGKRPSEKGGNQNPDQNGNGRIIYDLTRPSGCGFGPARNARVQGQAPGPVETVRGDPPKFTTTRPMPGREHICTASLTVYVSAHPRAPPGRLARRMRPGMYVRDGIIPHH